MNERGIEEVHATRFSEAEDLFRRAIDTWPEFASAWGNLGVSLMHQQRYFEALFVLLHALELDADDPNCRYNLGLLLTEHGQEMGMEQFQECLRLDPEYSDAAYYLGMIHHHRGEAETAREYFQKALELNPQDTRSLVWLAREAYEAKDYEKAITLCQKALDQDPSPSDPEVYMGLGHSYAGLGDYERAEEYFERYVMASPYDAYGHYLLACVYATQGKTDLALQSLGDALSLSREEVLEFARDDPRLETLRNSPEFWRLIGEEEDRG